MAAGLEIVRFSAGEKLFLEGERTYFFFIIQSGAVSIYKESPLGERAELAVVGEGQAVGEFALIDRRPRSATAEAMNDVIAVKISDGAYQGMLKELPTWAQSVMESLVAR